MGVNLVNMNISPIEYIGFVTLPTTVWLSGGRIGETRGAEQLNHRGACLRAAQAARPLEPVLEPVLLECNWVGAWRMVSLV